MNIQTKTKVDIIIYGGLDLLIIDLMALAPFVPKDKLYHLNEIKIFYTLVHQMEIDFTEFSINNEARVVSALNLFMDLDHKQPRSITRFLIPQISKFMALIPSRYLRKVV